MSTNCHERKVLKVAPNTKERLIVKEKHIKYLWNSAYAYHTLSSKYGKLTKSNIYILKKGFDQEAWDRNEWIESDIVQKHFNMTFSECVKKFGFNRQAEWNNPPLNGQKITTHFRKHI